MREEEEEEEKEAGNTFQVGGKCYMDMEKDEAKDDVTEKRWAFPQLGTIKSHVYV